MTRTQELYTTAGAAIASGYSVRRIEQMAKAGTLPSILLRGSDRTHPQRVYRENDVARLAARRKAA